MAVAYAVNQEVAELAERIALTKKALRTREESLPMRYLEIKSFISKNFVLVGLLVVFATLSLYFLIKAALAVMELFV